MPKIPGDIACCLDDIEELRRICLHRGVCMDEDARKIQTLKDQLRQAVTDAAMAQKWIYYYEQGGWVTRILKIFGRGRLAT